MKKQIKKLTLNKETLRDLEENRMREVAAGAPPLNSHFHTCGIACTVDTCV
jgi:hypothetical protein